VQCLVGCLSEQDRQLFLEHADCGEETAVWAAGDGGVVGWRRRRCERLETAAWVAGDGGAVGDWRRHRLGLDRAQGLV